MQARSGGEQGVAEPVAPADPVAERPEAPAARGSRPALVMRPQLGWRVMGPGLILLAVVLVAVGRVLAVPVAFVLAAAGAALLPAWWDRIEVSGSTIVKRAWRGRYTVTVGDVDAMGLRRVALPALRFLPRGYRFGRYWTIPLTLRLLTGDTILLELRCVWWRSWRELARFLVRTQPALDMDGRTRGRLERYVGLLLPASQR
jgi:hypothetical protein